MICCVIVWCVECSANMSRFDSSKNLSSTMMTPSRWLLQRMYHNSASEATTIKWQSIMRSDLFLSTAWKSLALDLRMCFYLHLDVKTMLSERRHHPSPCKFHEYTCNQYKKKGHITVACSIPCGQSTLCAK